MKKVFRKTLCVILVITMLLSAVVFAIPSSAAVFPQNLKNADAAVNYTASHALEGKYLLEIDAIKYSPNTTLDPQPIKSEPGSIIVTYKPNNGLAPEVTVKFEDVIQPNVFDTLGKGQFTYYAVIDGFPQKVTVSMKKTNVEENDSGIYTGLKIWNTELGMFTSVHDFTDIQMTNGIGTSDLMFSSITVENSYYPFAKDGTATMNNLTLPAGQSATTAVQTFSVVDQWGVTMIAPKFTYPTTAGLTFSQNKNVMTVKGTGDANIADASRTLTLKATYETLNSTVTTPFSLSKSFTVYSSSNRTYAPTYANRERAGITVRFKAGDNEVEKFVLNSAHNMTTANYVVLKNNASRDASVMLSSNASDKFSFAQERFTLSAGETKSVQLLDGTCASTDYYADVKVDYTLAGLYDAQTNMLATLSTGATIPLVYSDYGFVPSGRIYQKGGFGYSEIDVKVELKCNSGACLFTQNSFYLKNDPDEYQWDVDCYINRDNYTTYEQTGLNFFFTNQYKHEYYFQDQDKYLGSYSIQPYYDNCGTFGLDDGADAYTSGHKDNIGLKLNKGSGNTASQAFHGTLPTGSTSANQPVNLYFDTMQIHAWGSGSAYFTLPLRLYVYSKSDLRSQVATCKSAALLSCYYNQSKWAEYASMDSSALRTAQMNLGLDKTSQYNVTSAKTNLAAAYSNLLSSTSSGSYSLIHNKHNGDIESPIAATSVDYFVIGYGASKDLQFNNAYSTACNRHTAVYVPVMSTKGSYTYTYDYWNINFTSLENVLAEYNEVAKPGQFSNVEDAVGGALTLANSVDTSTSGDSDSPQKQSDVESIANNLRSAMRSLRYTSYTMTITHKMLDPTGKYEINNDEVHTYTQTINNSATYGEYVDGTADLDNGTYTVKNRHFSPQKDPKFMEYASSQYMLGISSEYECQENKDITMVYLAQAVQDTQLDECIAQTLVDTQTQAWEDSYTRDSKEAFEAWYYAKESDGSLSRTFTVFEQEEYNALLAEYQSELAKLDPIITETEIGELNAKINNYHFLNDFSRAICGGEEMLGKYEQAFDDANAILAKVDEQNAGSHAAQAVLKEFDGMVLEEHEREIPKLAGAPLDGVDGTYNVICPDCKQILDTKAFLCPHFNQFTTWGYDYNNRGASLRIRETDDVNSEIQDLRFTASCFVPEGAVVKDFGYVYTQTNVLNNYAEPTNNTPVNINSLIINADKVTKKSLVDGHYTVHPAQDGSVFTFNLVINVEKQNWDKHYAARSYIVYEIDGMEVLVYDITYSSRSPLYVAQQVVKNKSESRFAREFIAQKFGISQ